ncbi:MAG: hypothetical protein AAGK32_19910 [Actinomycetota bacterium]
MSERRARVTCLFRGRLGNQLYAVATTLAHAWDHDLRPRFGSWHRQLVANPEASARNRVTQVLPRLPTRPVVVLRSNAYMVHENKADPGPPAPRHRLADARAQGLPPGPGRHRGGPGQPRRQPGRRRDGDHGRDR